MSAARLVEEFYDGTAEKDWPAWASEAVAILERSDPDVLADHRRLVRELDVLLNGDGAAKQASLCDIVGQVRAEGIRARGVSRLDDKASCQNHQGVDASGFGEGNRG